jgi:hypothetical protein
MRLERQRVPRRVVSRLRDVDALAVVDGLAHLVEQRVDGQHQRRDARLLLRIGRRRHRRDLALERHVRLAGEPQAHVLALRHALDPVRVSANCSQRAWPFFMYRWSGESNMTSSGRSRRESRHDRGLDIVDSVLHVVQVDDPEIVLQAGRGCARATVQARALVLRHLVGLDQLRRDPGEPRHVARAGDLSPFSVSMWST